MPGKLSPGVIWLLHMEHLPDAQGTAIVVHLTPQRAYSSVRRIEVYYRKEIGTFRLRRLRRRLNMAAAREPDEQLKLGLRMIEGAYEEKSRAMEQELQNLRSFSKERQAQISALERRVSELEMQLRESEQQKQQFANEKSHLAQEVKAMQRDLSKLDQFKRSIMQSIQDDEPVPARYRAGAGASTYDLSPPAPAFEPTPAAPRAYSPPHISPPRAATASVGGGGLSTHTAACSPPAVPPACQEYRTVPAHASGSTDRSHYQQTACTARSRFDAQAYQTSAPTDSGSAHLDGKDFFRQARLRLTYEQFNQACQCPAEPPTLTLSHARRALRCSRSSSPTSRGSTTTRRRARTRCTAHRKFSARKIRTSSSPSRIFSPSTA